MKNLRSKLLLSLFALCWLVSGVQAQTPTKPAGRWPPTVSTTVNKTVWIPSNKAFEIRNTHINGGGWIGIGNNQREIAGPSFENKVQILDCILSFQPDQPGQEVSGAAANWLARAYGTRFVDVIHVEARNCKREHAFYFTPETGGLILFRQCYVHDIGSQGAQFRPEAQTLARGNLANSDKGLIRFENCYFFNCGQAYGTRTSHTIKLFAFQKADDTFEPTKLDLELVDTWIVNEGLTSWVYNKKTYNSMGGVFCQAGDSFTMVGGGIDLKNPQYQLMQIIDRNNVLIDGGHFVGDKVELVGCGDDPATFIDEGGIVIRNTTGNAMLQVKAASGKVIYQGPLNAGYNQP